MEKSVCHRQGNYRHGLVGPGLLRTEKMKVNLPCAIYTRKSSEEGLEQGFNSLDAQREACEAYIASQKHEGWKALPFQYDDGGFSGDNMERPGLRQLLKDIDNRKIRVVVVYKVDRLTRSLADFAKIIEQFDVKGVSFVSVTQQFNTTSSMRRLTLNVLLSFAQFEREVTGERIRDKIAASKQKGMWMGGIPPMGYVGKERNLAIEDSGATLVRHIFERYLELGHVRALKEELDRMKIGVPCRVTKAGKVLGGQPFARGHLYATLNNPIYIGRIPHKDQSYPWMHPAIIEQEVWDKVQAQLELNKQGHGDRRSAPSASLLTGILFDQDDHPLIPSHSQKQSKHYRYYVSEPLITKTRDAAPQGIRLPAIDVERLVIQAIVEWLIDPHAILAATEVTPEAIEYIKTRAADLATKLQIDHPYAVLRQIIERVTIHSEQVSIEIKLNEIMGITNEALYTLNVYTRIKRCGRTMRLLIQGAQGTGIRDQALIAHLSKAHRWLNLLTSGKVRSIKEISDQEKRSSAYIIRVIEQGLLALDIIRAIMAGSQPAELNLAAMKKLKHLPVSWQEQRMLLDF
ncbi:MAG: Site-specific recombinase [Fluviibacter phosphoraccumulans EoVTN8]